jgi:hypothetical protein
MTAIMLMAVIQTAYPEGVSTRKVDRLVQSLGLEGIDKSRVSRICRQLDEAVQSFRKRPLDAAYPYVWLDAFYVKVRQNHRIVNVALVIAIEVRETGEREILGVEISGSEEESFWRASLRGLVERGLRGVELARSARCPPGAAEGHPGGAGGPCLAAVRPAANGGHTHSCAMCWPCAQSPQVHRGRRYPYHPRSA